MKGLLIAVGVVLSLDAALACLMLLLWMARGHTPDFVEASIYGVLSMLMVFLKIVGGSLGAIQLFRLRQSGRAIAAVVVTYNALFALGAGLRAGALSAMVWGTVALNLAMLAVVLLPAAGAVCEAVASPPTRRGFPQRSR